jgi:polar amino acid transport system substrate-binding protein
MPRPDDPERAIVPTLIIGSNLAMSSIGKTVRARAIPSTLLLEETMHRPIRLTALVAAVALLLAACTTGASPSPSASAPAEPTTGASAPTGSSAEPSGGVPSFAPDSLLGKVYESGTIRISTDPNYKPFSFLNTDTGQYEGFDTGTAEETVKRLSEKLGKEIKIQWETPGWDLITAGSWGGRWDISIGSMSVTETRAKVVDFVDPYYYDAGGIAVPKDSTLTSMDQLNGGKTFCVGTATTYEQWLNKTLEIVDPNLIEPPTDPQVTALPTDNECIQSVAAGRTFDAIVANKNGLEDAVASGQPIKMLIDEPTFTVSVAFALDKSGPDTSAMLQVLNEIVGEMHADGTLKALSEKWLGEDATTKPS